MSEAEETDQYGRTIFKVPVKAAKIAAPTGAAPGTAKDGQKRQHQNSKHIKPVDRKHLEPGNRDFRPDEQVGKTFSINAEQIKTSQLGSSTSAATTQQSEGQVATSAFYCDSCKCSLKDSQAWFDHINGKKHNQLLGMSMIVEKVSVDRVKAKLALLSQKKKGHVPSQPAMRPKLEEFGEDEDSF